MKKSTIIALTLGMIGLASGQDALKKAKSDLATATKKFEQNTSLIAQEEAQLVRKVEALDGEVIKLSKEYKKLLREEELVTHKQKQLDTELEKRDIEFKFHNGVFDRYLRETQNKIHVAEVQTKKESFREHQARIDVAGKDVAKRVEASLPMLEQGIERILNLAGGATFAGRAQSEDAMVVNGQFAVVGPLGFYASDDKSIAGATDELTGSIEFPAILPTDPEAIGDLVTTGSGAVLVDGSLGKAYKMEKATKGLSDYIEGGGIVGYVIVGLGIFAFLVGIVKMIEIMAFHIPNRSVINQFLDAKLTNGNSAAIANGVKGLCGKVVQTGDKYFHTKRRILEDALFEKLSAIPPKLERGLPFLSLVAASAPMLGLLGTVLGIMKTFALMSEGGSSNIKFISGGISEALITTFMGLAVAIPILLLHGFLKGMAKGKISEAEGVAMSIINGTSEIKKPVKEEVEIEDMVPAK